MVRPSESQNQIILSISKTGWNATFVGPHRENIVRVFHTDMIPTPFTAEADPAEVRKAVQECNPDCQVSFRMMA